MLIRIPAGFRLGKYAFAIVVLVAGAQVHSAAAQPAAGPATGVPGNVAAAGTGVAKQYWLRTLGGNETLWLFINGGWRQLNKPSPALIEAVQDTFCDCPSALEVVGSYSDSTLSWVVVRTGAVPVTKTVKVVDMIPRSLSGESQQDSEPFLAIDRAVTKNMVATAFTLNPNPAASGRAPVYVTNDGGNTWLLNDLVPSDKMTSDITVAATNTSKRLHAGILKRPGGLLMNVLRTNDFFSNALMSVRTSRGSVDQPFVQAHTVGAAERVYDGNNDFGAAGGRTATVDVSLDGGNSYKTVRIESRATAGQDGPSVRPAMSGDGTVYVAYFGWRSFVNNVATSDIVVVRDDNGATGASPFQDLKDPSDGLPGRKVVSGVTIPWSNAPTVGNERIGSTLSIAVHPSNSNRLCVAWADDNGGTVTYMAHVRCSKDRGQTWSGDLRRVTNATPFALASADNGTLGFLYQQFVGGRWVTHLEQTRDDFATIDDTVLATVAANAPSPQFLPYLGDYNFLLSSGNEFRGIFSTSNMPDKADFPHGVSYQRIADFTTHRLLDGAGNSVPISIDPFYFSVSVLK